MNYFLKVDRPFLVYFCLLVKKIISVVSRIQTRIAEVEGVDNEH